MKAYVRDLWGRAVKITDATGTDTFYSYDYAGNLTSSTDGNGNTTYYTYNSMNLLSKITDPEGETILYKYDLQGRLSQKIDRNGNIINYAFNADDNLTGRTVEGQEIFEKYLYNKDGSLLAAINNSYVESFEYTDNGKLKKRYENGLLSLQYSYNKNLELTELADRFGNTVRYTYDLLGRLKEVYDSNTLMASYTYNPDSTISGTYYSTGIKTTYQYDRDKNITAVENIDPQGNMISSFAYSYDNNGNVLTKTKNGQTTSYTYDELNRLKSVQYPNAEVETYTYDNAGNRISKSLGLENISYSYDSRNRLMQSIKNGIISTYLYDNNGNQTAVETNGKTTTYTYDAFNRLVEVTNPDGTWMRNIYNAEGLRVSILENGIWTGFTFDRGNVVAELDKNNELTSCYIRGYGIIAQKNSSNQTGYYLHNSHGDVTEIADENGNVLNSYSYDAFGITLSYTETVANRFRYAGQQYDRITKLYYLRARYYAPNIGRFIQEDPYRGDGLNLYVYVSNNPLKYIDLSGLCKDEGGEPSFWSATGNFFGGIWDGAKDTVSGLWYVATHGDEVINTVADIFESNEAMYQTGKAIYSSVRNYVEANIINGNANTRARAAGRIVFEVGTAIIGTKGLDKVDKISDAGRAVRYADDVARYVDDVGRGIKKINLQQFASKAKGTSKTVDDLLEGATRAKSTKGRSKIYNKVGDFNQAFDDFNSLNPRNVRDIDIGKVGTLEDGRTVIVRTKSSDGRITLEIQKGNNKIKIRYSK